MSMSITQVLSEAGYDLSKPEDANWLLGQRNTWEELVEQAEEVVDNE